MLLDGEHLVRESAHLRPASKSRRSPAARDWTARAARRDLRGRHTGPRGQRQVLSAASPVREPSGVVAVARLRTG